MSADEILNKQFVMTDSGRVDYIKDLYTTFNHKVDLEALINGGYIDAVGKMMEPVTISLDDHSPEVVAYWAKHGMVKEFHGQNTPFSWTEYAAKTGYRYKGRKYPVVFMLHGGFNPISIIDGWGVPQEAAKREWIVIAPSIELDDVLEDILNEAKELYPIDESRVYVAGFSYGGFTSNYLGNKRADLFAAVCPCGAPISNAYCEKPMGPEPQKPFDGVSSAAEMGTYMPVMNIYGNLDGFRFPLYDAKTFNPTGKLNEHQLKNITPELVEGINHWLRTNKAKEIRLEDVWALKDAIDTTVEEKAMGIPLDKGCGHTVVADGVTNYIADFPSADGIVRTKIMCEMNMPHWPTPEMSRQMFDFFSHFSRDRKTGESIYQA